MRFEHIVTLKDGRPCLLRSGEAGDACEFAELFRVTHAETDFLLTYPDEHAIDPVKEAEWFSDMLDNPRAAEVLAFVDGRMVGSAGFSPVGSKRKNRHRADLGIAVLREYWGRGIGRALMAACVDLAREAGYRQVELEVVAENQSAIRLYESLGFVEYGRNPRAFVSDLSGWQEVVLMRIEL